MEKKQLGRNVLPLTYVNLYDNQILNFGFFKPCCGP